MIDSSPPGEAALWWGESVPTRVAFVIGLLVGAASLVWLLGPLGWWLSIAGWAIVFFGRWLGAVSGGDAEASTRQTILELLQRFTIGILLGGGVGLLVVGAQEMSDANGEAAVAALAGAVAVFTTALVLAKGDQRLLGLVFFAVGIAVYLIGDRILAQIFLAFGVLASGLPRRIRAWVDQQSGR